MPPNIRQLCQPWKQLTCLNWAKTGTSTASESTTFAQQCHASTVAQRRRKRDPYALAQARARKAANLSRKEVLNKERAASLGDPVRGKTTPLVQSFDTGLPPARTQSSPSEETSGSHHDSDRHINFLLTKQDLDSGIVRSNILATNMDVRQSAEYFEVDVQEAKMEHQNAEEALRRISNISLGTGKDLMRINKQRCIDIFGRHNTDQYLPPRPKLSTHTQDGEQLPPIPRVGPDTGSSEVQAAILTAKIRALADVLERRGPNDKMNKRNLRLLVHRRAKLLKYLRRKERGGPRWQNLVESLGLTDGTWKGEITL